ncbi:MAG: thiamine phosphate synthase, partial [Alphaproteobacteria bacterium]
WRRATAALMPTAQERDVAFILNDRADLAAELDCDGVHIGKDDTPYAEARALLGPDKIIGVTCKASNDLATDAAEAGADYVAFGAFFESTTKQIPPPASLDILNWWSDISTVPSVAIGGITASNCAPVVQAGADFLAIAGGVWNHPDGPAGGVAAATAAIKAVLAEG